MSMKRRRTVRMVVRESPTVEYKESVTPTFLKTVSAYANYGTGKIEFGVDDGGVAVGLSDPVAECLRIENMINDSLDPAPRYTLELDENRGTVTLTVYEGQDKPYRSKGKAYRRNDSATVEVDRFEYGRLTLEGSNLTFDALTSARQDLSFHTLEHKCIEHLGISELTSDIMRTLRLLGKDGYTNAAAILADNNEFPGIDCVRFGDTEDVLLDRETTTGLSAIEQVDRAVAMFARYYRYERIEGVERVQTDRIPLEAFREAVANALVHRTWDVQANVQVALYDDRVVVTSPGSLPAGLTTEQYLYGQISVLRNPIVAEVFLKLDYIEKFGTGIARIRRAYRDSINQPVFDIRGGVVAVALPVTDAFEGSGEEAQVLKALSGGRIMSRSEIEKQTGLSRARTLSALESLLSRNAIMKQGTGRATKYERA
ncbi:AAA family ATPase [Collinsella sp. AF19-7AC]|nr:AAA family ATPase [Collinsella sp. TF06-6AC]RGT06370.1 AAA family ATPase [Collinsella sp. AF19-7AC]RGT33544.1 AAA family ATPase [Collinsella sp. AF19-1LB]RGU43388.1 AAA family ATPase [Collinsella sp. AF16-8]RGX53702.1 AAA family ATPase [Collinsella sp. AF02-46-1]RHE30247.1 AAA family ATPase [Collinsella sp. AM29-10AC]RHI28471.1 AAA family ATPase [Collinsella sp. AM15-2]RHL70044.1 AAA family ATPase [Collinsella sp. AF36-3AT]